MNPLFIIIGVFLSALLFFIVIELVENLFEIRKEKNNPYRKYLVGDLQISASNIKKEDSEEKKDAKKKGEFSNDIVGQMLKNYDEIREYFQISKSQSRWSFRLSALACVSGIIILAITVYSVIILKQTDIAVVGVISGAITEVIAGTIFWLHNKSALQLNHYYDALHENEKVLLAINLTNTLSLEERESMCKEIIRTRIYKQKIDK